MTKQDTLSVTEAAEILNMNKSLVYKSCDKGLFSNCIKENSRWRIPKVEVEKLNGCVSLREAAEILHLSKTRLIELCKENRIEGAFKFGRAWKVPLSTLQNENPIRPANGARRREIHRIKIEKWLDERHKAEDDKKSGGN